MASPCRAGAASRACARPFESISVAAGATPAKISACTRSRRSPCHCGARLTASVVSVLLQGLPELDGLLLPVIYLAEL
jgi:hypothetical protein